MEQISNFNSSVVLDLFGGSGSTLKAVATKPPIVPKAKPKATKPPIVPKAEQKATTESPFKNNKGFINPSEIKKSLIPKK